YRSGHIAGAKHIVMDDLSNHFDSMDKNQAVALYCYTGATSGKALAQMKKAGFTDVAHLTGGIAAWKTENLPTTTS
ncbi:MAG: rhodanese-like domain-containing protein, partial [Gammaproteobacteria bacterium]|nr:rhodanese-like domain-containing protein [Gammaproteobacteria bacterium]